MIDGLSLLLLLNPRRRLSTAPRPPETMNLDLIPGYLRNPAAFYESVDVDFETIALTLCACILSAAFFILSFSCLRRRSVVVVVVVLILIVVVPALFYLSLCSVNPVDANHLVIEVTFTRGSQARLNHEVLTTIIEY